jgi:hypothetical protein
MNRPSNGGLVAKWLRSRVDHHISHDTNVVHTSVDLITPKTGELASWGRAAPVAGRGYRRVQASTRRRYPHTSRRLASGVPLPAVSARLGHGSIRTTQEIYSHMIHGHDDEAGKKWEEFSEPAEWRLAPESTGSERLGVSTRACQTLVPVCSTPRMPTFDNHDRVLVERRLDLKTTSADRPIERFFLGR